MKRDWRAVNANNEDKKENTKDKVFFYTEQHDQSCNNIQKLRIIKRDCWADDVSNREKKESWSRKIYKVIN